MPDFPILHYFLEFAQTHDLVPMMSSNHLTQQTVENSSRDGNTSPPELSPEKSVCRSRSKLELDMEQQTGSRSGKEYVKAAYCHPAYLTSMQCTS